MTFVKKPKKEFIKPAVKKQEVIKEEVKPQITDTTKMP